MSVEQQAYPWAGMPFVGSAYAAKKVTKRRLAGLAFGKKMAKFASTGNGVFIRDPKQISSAIRAIAKLAKGNGLSKELRKLVHTGTLLKGTTRLVRDGQRNVKEVLKGRKDQRVSPILILGAIAYIETSIGNGTLSSQNQIQIEIGELLAKIFLTGQNKRAKANRHGAMFHLLMVAYYHAQYEFAGGEPIFELEGKRSIIYKNGTEKYLPYAREVDLVLGTKESQHWVELKSKAWPFNKGEFGRWTLTQSRKSGSIHKQFTTDRVATFVKSNEGVTVPDAVSWLFQSFKAKDSSKGPTEKNINSFGLRKKLCLLPKTSQKTVDNSTVLEDTIGVSKEEFSLVCKVKQYDLIRIMNNKTVLKQMISNGLLDDIKDLIDDELLL